MEKNGFYFLDVIANTVRVWFLGKGLHLKYVLLMSAIRRNSAGDIKLVGEYFSIQCQGMNAICLK
jgi:hypothetical protein